MQAPSLGIIPRRKRSLTRYILLAFLLFGGLFFWQLFGPAPMIRVSPQTTHITTPLGPDGLPDYVTYQQDKLSAGVTQENNAAVLMWQAFGPGEGSSGISPENWRHISQELQLPPPTQGYLIEPESERVTKSVEAWVTANDPAWKAVAENAATNGDPELLPEDLGFNIVFAAMDAPWRRADVPPLADWADANGAALDSLVEASRRPRFFSPFALPEGDAKQTLFDLQQLDAIIRSRSIARALGVRGMLHIGEGRHAAAWQDLLAVHRWARLVGQGSTLIEQLVAVAMEGIAAMGTQTLLAEKLPPDLARQIHADLLALGPPSDMARSFDEGERLYFLDAVVSGHQTGMGTFLSENLFVFEPVSDSIKALDFVAVDWNVTLTKGNQIYDQLVAACRQPSYAARQTSCQAFERDMLRLDAQTHGFHNFALGTISPTKRSNMLAASIITLMSPAFDASFEAEDRANAKIALLRIAAALAVYRAEHGEYPDHLAQLVPGVITQLPVDLYHAKPIVYQRSANGYLLYSHGENGRDDGGSHELMEVLEGRKIPQHDEDAAKRFRQKIPSGADDHAIRVPAPAFKIPAPPPSTNP